MKTLRIFFYGICAGALLSCASDSPPPTNAETGNNKRIFADRTERSRPTLELPPDLLSSANAKLRENSAATAGTTDNERVLPTPIGVTIRTDKGRKFLEVEADAKEVWRKLNEFWALQEISLSDYRPEAGIMETDWFSRTGNAASADNVAAVASGLLKDFIAQRTAADKFTLRLTRAGDSTQLFITHRRREKIAKEYNNLQKASEYNWVERDEDPEKVAQLLQELVALFGGAEEPS